jgi:hypothetical protein
MIGLSDATFPLADLFWGFRRLLENVSRRRPVVLLIEDLHWAEPTLHDLLESLSSSDFSAGTLTVCSGRTELLESRPELATAPAITLGRLGESETAAMIEAWLGGPLDAAGLARIVGASSGNPLFTASCSRCSTTTDCSSRKTAGSRGIAVRLAATHDPCVAECAHRPAGDRGSPRR